VNLTWLWLPSNMHMDCVDGRFYTFCISAKYVVYFVNLRCGHFNTLWYFDASINFYRHGDENKHLNVPLTILIPTVFSLILTNCHWTSHDASFNLIELHVCWKFRKIWELKWELDIIALELFIHLLIYLWYNKRCRQ